MAEKEQAYEPSEIESVLQKALQKQNQRNSTLQLELDLARSQIEYMKEQEGKRAEKEVDAKSKAKKTDEAKHSKKK